MGSKAWIIREPSKEAERLAKEARIPLYAAEFLAGRGVRSREEAEAFMTKRLASLGQPRELGGAIDAAKAIITAIRNGVKICIHGDYDVDGAAATAIMLQAITAVGGDAGYFIPNREDGYGLKAERMVELAAAGYGLLVAVDCGITAVDAVAKANAVGLPVVIIDHHTPGQKLPDALATVHPWFGRGFKNLCAAGAAFKVAWAIGQLVSGGDKVTPEYRESLMTMLGHAGLATVADMVPLVGENRILAARGSDVIATRPPVGIAAMLDVMNADRHLPEGPDLLGFYLAPALNSAGRIGVARLAVELLTTTDAKRARELAIFLNEQNKTRRRIERSMLAEANEIVVMNGHLEKSAIVIENSTWRSGCLGPVASRLAEKYSRPVVLFAATEGGSASGSARSARGVNILDALGQCADLLASFGGHASAAGMTIERGKIDAFRERLCLAVDAQGVPVGDSLVVDAVVNAGEVNAEMAHWARQLGPFGNGNARPVLATCGVQIDNPKTVGNGEHFSFSVKDKTGTAKAIYFGHGKIAHEFYGAMRIIDVAFEPKESSWGGVTRCDMHVLAIRDHASNGQPKEEPK